MADRIMQALADLRRHRSQAVFRFESILLFHFSRFVRFVTTYIMIDFPPIRFPFPGTASLPLPRRRSARLENRSIPTNEPR